MERTENWPFPLNASRPQRCIYCLQETTASNVLPFNTEHVVPHHATRKVRNNLLLRNLVCQPCNDFFGRTLDDLVRKPILATAAHLLYQFPIDCLESDSQSFAAHFHIECKKYSVLDGALGVITMRNRKPQVTLHSQIALELDDGRWFHVYRKRWSAIEPTVLKPSGIAFAISDAPTLNHAKNRLRAQRFTLLSLEEMVGQQEREAITLASLEVTIHRAIAKIAFNYLAWALAKHPSILYSNAFDDIRNFVLFQSRTTNLVTRTDEPSTSKKFANKHRLYLRSVDDETGQGLQAYVNLFGVMEYRVTLSTQIQCLKRLGIRNEHVWDVPARLCQRIPHQNEFRIGDNPINSEQQNIAAEG